MCECVCVYVCVCMSVSVCVCVCECVSECGLTGASWLQWASAAQPPPL